MDTIQNGLLNYALDHLKDKGTFSMELQQLLAHGYNRHVNDGEPLGLDEYEKLVGFDGGFVNDFRWKAKLACLDDSFKREFLEAGGDPGNYSDVAIAVYQKYMGAGVVRLKSGEVRSQAA